MTLELCAWLQSIQSAHMCCTRRMGLSYLRIEEASHPVGFWAASIQPLVELVIPLQQPQEPVSQCAGLPRLLQPVLGNASIEERIQAVYEASTEGNGTGDGQAQILEGAGGELDDNVEAV